MKIYVLILVLIITFSVKGISKVNNGIYIDFDQIKKVKNDIQQKNKSYLPAYIALLEKAESALTEGPWSVMDKKRTPPSGNKHDYISMGPYWWPDPDKADGLPYIRKDGEVNPETRGDYIDTGAKNKMFSNLETLGWAYYFSEDEKYAKKAIELIQTWFINAETKMNPNLNYAQGIPGRTEGRGIGIIDWAGIQRLISPLQILEAENMLDKTTETGIKKWLESYLNWLLTSENGRSEDDYFNNHGTWYDVQVVGIEMYLGKTIMAKKRLENTKTKRIASQIEADGSQPHELARTKSLSYSTMNLRGFIHLANLAKKVNINLWDFKTNDGRGIRPALDFLLPIAQGKEKWTHQQLGHLEDAIESLKKDYLMAANATSNKDYLHVARSIKNPQTNLDILLYPIF